MKQTIKNRKGQNIVVLVEEQANQRGLAFVMHGLGTNKEQPQIAAIAEAFINNGYTAIRFDCSNSLGESEGDYSNVTATTFLEDLEDVIAWSVLQSWYEEPFCLSGSSLGGYATARFAELHPEKVKALFPKATTISGKLSVESDPKHYQAWKDSGWRIEKSNTRPGFIKRLPWSHMEDRMMHDLLPDAGKLTMPVLIMVGDQDDTSPPVQQKMLYDLLPGKKEFHLVPGHPHTLRDPSQIQEMKSILDEWIKKLE
ncbi:MAG: alpha/beta hydrolase [Patescibacteria group bacterium]